MRKAICHYSFHRRWRAERWTADRLAEEVRALGIEGVDFHAGMPGASNSAPALIRSAVDKHGLLLSGLSLSNNFNQDDPDEFRRQVDRVKEWILVAAEVEAPVSRIFGGHLSADLRRDPAARAESRQRILEGLGEVVREAEKLDLVLALENHGGLPCTAEEQLDIIEAINSPYLRATIDVGNYLSCGQEGDAATRMVAAHCAYVHLKDFKKTPDDSSPWGWTTEACALGEGDIDLRACVEALGGAGFDGFVALEYEGVEDEETAVPKSVAFMNELI